MYRLLVVVTILCVAGLAYAELETSDKFSNAHPRGWGVPAYDGREGGETIADAVVIPSLPFNDTGATCDNIDDYEEVCPYSSTSPDVVYVYYPTVDEIIDVDLCGSIYDTKVFVYEDVAGNTVACNDDFYYDPTCGYYTSAVVEVNVTGGHAYYIVVDGWAGSCGTYSLEVRYWVACETPCPDEGVPEGEPTIVNYYLDSHNGGCNSPEFGNPFQVLEANLEPDCITLCGVSGLYWNAPYNSRDTDWFECTATGDLVTVDIDAEFSCYFFFLGPLDCATVEVVAYWLFGPCSPAHIEWPTTEGEVLWLWVGPSTWTPPEGVIRPWEFPYVMTVCGIYGPVATETSTWGGVKNLYR